MLFAAVLEAVQLVCGLSLEFEKEAVHGRRAYREIVRGLGGQMDEA